MTEKNIIIIIAVLIILGISGSLYENLFPMSESPWPSFLPLPRGNREKTELNESAAANRCVMISEESMEAEEAKQIALDSPCSQEGVILESYICNDNTGMWWIDIEPKNDKEGCNPACVVNIKEKTAEINWRCTGLIAP